MACPFCATGQGGLTRNLSTGEIVDQVVAAARAAARGELAGGAGRLSNVVFMGMGEPLANYNRLAAALHRLIDPAPAGLGLSRRVDHRLHRRAGAGDRRLADEELDVTLAVSLHAPDDELRDTLVPVNTRWKVAEVLAAADAYAARTGRRYSIEYAMIRDVNDQPLARRPARRPAGAAAGARQPDPAQPDAGLAVGRLAQAGRARVRPPPGGPRRAGDRPRHPRPRDRRRVRAAGGDGHLATVTR